MIVLFADCPCLQFISYVQMRISFEFETYSLLYLPIHLQSFEVFFSAQVLFYMFVASLKPDEIFGLKT
jgi:hypothetical protein